MAETNKYMSIQILGKINVCAFKNIKKKAGDTQPDYSGNGVAVWIKEGKASKTKEKELSL